MSFDDLLSLWSDAPSDITGSDSSTLDALELAEFFLVPNEELSCWLLIHCAGS